MGLNLYSACHKHKVKVFHFRSEEDKTMMPFYYKHRDCLEANPMISVETLEDQAQERDWMAEPEEGGYQNDPDVFNPAIKEVRAPLPPQQSPKPAKGSDAINPPSNQSKGGRKNEQG